MSDTAYPNLPVLLVDDEPQALQSCELMLWSGGIDHTLCCQDSRQVFDLLRRREISVLLLDLSMPHVSGEDILRTVAGEFPDLPVIIFTGFNEVDTAVRCMQLGAFDYMVKPVEKSRMISGVQRAIELREWHSDYAQLRRRLLSDGLEEPEAFGEIVTATPKMRALFRYCEAVARSTRPILLTGETGVGKELFARAIHRLSGRKGPFVPVNIAGLDDHVFYDTLFGHVKGAFTDARAVRVGLVEQAAGGALFLDEIGDLSPQSQVKLLRLLQEREYFPLGSDVPRRADAQFLVATNHDLDAALQNGQFRKDLFYRLSTHRIHIPPLRERPADLPLLLDHLLDKAALALGAKKPAVPHELLALLSTYAFPGNVRELESLVFDAVSNQRGKRLSTEVFRRRVARSRPAVAAPRLPHPHGVESGPVFSRCESLPTLREAADLLVAEALRRSGGNQTLASHLLGVTQPALSKRLNRRRAACDDSSGKA